jgi:hypothetical protein
MVNGPGRRGARPLHAASRRPTLLHAGDGDPDAGVADARGPFERRDATVERPQPQLAERDQEGGRGRDDRCEAKWVHTAMLAAPPDAQA